MYLDPEEEMCMRTRLNSAKRLERERESGNVTMSEFREQMIAIAHPTLTDAEFRSLRDAAVTETRNEPTAPEHTDNADADAMAYRLRLAQIRGNH